jgi:LysR family nitrogen assimilation transcriptional regulator
MDAVLIRAFMAIAQSGSITRASERLGIAQPSLSQQLLRLEDELGVKLFKRTARGVMLTEAGRVFEEHGRNILRDIDRAKDDLRAMKGEVSGNVVIGLPLSISLRFGIPLILAVREQRPQVFLTVEEAMSGDVRHWLEQGMIDLAVLYNADRIRQFSVKRVATEQMCVVGAPGQFGPCDARGIALQPLAMPDVTKLPLILPSKRHGLRQFVEAAFAGQDLAIEVCIEVDSLTHIKTLAAAGHGHTILSHAAVARELQNRSLSAAIVPTLERGVDIARDPSSIITRASVGVEDVLTAILRQAMADGWAAYPPLAAELKTPL